LRETGLRTTAFGAIGALILTAAAAPAFAGGYYDIGGAPPGYAPPCPPPRPPCPPCPCAQGCVPAPPEWGEAPPPGWGGPPPEDEGFAPAGFFVEGSGGYVGGGEVIEGGPAIGIDVFGRFDHGRGFYGNRQHSNQRVWQYESERASEHAQSSAHVSSQTQVQSATYVHVSGSSGASGWTRGGGGWMRGGGWSRR
jgi:hypothetical protein